MEALILLLPCMAFNFIFIHPFLFIQTFIPSRPSSGEGEKKREEIENFLSLFFSSTTKLF